MQQRAEWLDFIKVYGVLATIFLHTNSRLVNFQIDAVDFPVTLNMLYWDISAVFASLAGPSFALIFMYFGATVLSSKHSSISFFMSKIKSLIIPLIFWTIFALLFRKYIMHWDINFWHELLLLPFKAQSNNMWILYILISLFLITPILKIFINNSTRTQQIYFVILRIYAIAVPPLLNIDMSLTTPMMTGYIGYMVLGYLLTQATLTKKLLQIGTILFVIGNFWTIVGSIYYNTPEGIVKGIYVTYFFDRFSLPMLFNTVGLFILLRYVAERVMRVKRVHSGINKLSTVALGMCMVYEYWYIILGTEKLSIGLTAFSGNPLWSVPLTAFMTIIGSFLTVYVIKKIPYLHHITPKLY